MKLKWDLPGKLPVFLDRYKLPLLILLLGVGLMLWPSGSNQTEPTEAAAPPVEASQPEDAGQRYRAKTERELEQLLTQVDGAGRVRVMLTLRTGPASEYQTDKSRTSASESDRHSESLEEKTVILDRGSAYNEPAVVSTAYPVFQGALIVAEGGGDAKVRYELSAAVAALLGLGTDQITVVKMK